MDNEAIAYIIRKVRADFDSCGWEDSVGKKFGQTMLPAIEKSLRSLERETEDTERLVKEGKRLLSETSEQ